MESKQYSWKWVTASERLSQGACELVYASLYPTSDAGYATLYDGENTLGDTIVIPKSATQTLRDFSPAKPIYCRKGLYVAVSNAYIFVQWRELGHKEG